MKRRAFLRSLGGAVAAAMMPFTAPIQTRFITGKWYDGIVKALRECDQYVELMEPTVEQKDFMKTFFFNKRIPNSYVELWTSIE